MLEGKRILSQIPGVREVFTGEATHIDSEYQFFWSVRFTHNAALKSFREHQEFDSFLKNQFNPNVSDLMRIDYKENV